jgi:hypothetical protein
MYALHANLPCIYKTITLVKLSVTKTNFQTPKMYVSPAINHAYNALINFHVLRVILVNI